MNYSKEELKKILAERFNCREDQIGTEISDFDSHDIVVYFGDLKYEGSKVPETFKNLKFICGDALFINLRSASGLEKLQRIDGDAWFSKLSRAEGLNNLQYIGGNADLPILIRAKGLENLQSIGGDALFFSLISAEGLEKLQTIGGYADFINLQSAEGLKSLQTIGGDADFGQLTSAKGFEHLQRIGGNANFKNLTRSEVLAHLQSIGGQAYFSAADLSNDPEDVIDSNSNNGFFYEVDGKTTGFVRTTGLEYIQRIGGNANFPRLTSAEGLEKLSDSEDAIASNSNNDYFYEVDGLTDSGTVTASDLLDEGIDDVQNNDRGSIKR